MNVQSRKNEEKFFERTRIALINAVQQEAIKLALANFEYNAAKIAEGQKLYDSSKATWDLNIKEDAETENASAHYKSKYEAVEALFIRHRHQAQLFFKKDPDTLVKLGVKGRFPKTYREFFTKVQQFYTGIKADAQIQKEFNRIKIDAKVVVACIASIDELLKLRAEFDKEDGESQEATKQKNAAMIEMKEWMDDFDSIAQIALYDEPQLLESLGIFVRS